MATPAPADALLDSIAIVECISRDDVEALAALLRHTDLTATAAVLDSLLARDLIYTPLVQVCGIVTGLAQELQQDPSPGGRVVSIARCLAVHMCDECVQGGQFRTWALSQGHGHG